MATTPKITGVDWDMINKDAETWAREYGGELVKKIDEGTRRDVGNAVGDFYSEGQTMGELTDRLGRIYSPQRAERIAITEVTRAAAEGERGIAKELAKDGVIMVEVWQTRNDLVVCAICEPRNGMEEGTTWTRGSGTYKEPPAHPNCRCNIRLDYPKPKEGEVEVQPEEFTNITDINKWGNENYSTWRESLTAEELEILKGYQSTDYKWVNSELRTGKGIDDESREFHRVLDNILGRGATNRDIVAYRGISTSSFEGTESGMIIRDNAYISTSLDEASAGRFLAEKENPMIAELRIPKGSKGAYIEGVLDMKEYEFLMPRGSEFRVISSGPGIVDAYGDKVQVTRIIMELING